MIRILLLTLSLLFTQELEVQGDLKISGSIDAQNNPVKNVGAPQSLTDAINGNVLQDALRDDGPFEYMFLYLKFVGSGYSTSNTWRYVEYIIPTDVNTGDMEWQEGGTSQLNQLSQQGWKINTRLTSGYGSDAFYIYELKRLVEE